MQIVQGGTPSLKQVVFEREFKIWRSLQHKNILQLSTVFLTNNTVYMVTEECFLTLHSFIKRYGFFKRDKVRGLLKELLEGVLYLHEKGIMHRDLKLDNIMLRKGDLNEGKLLPQIIDFGLADYVTAQPYLYLKCGTPGFTAPEILAIDSADTAQLYNEKCDIFSIGVIAYILYSMPYLDYARGLPSRVRSPKRSS